MCFYFYLCLLLPKLTHLPTIILGASSTAASLPPTKHYVPCQCPFVCCLPEGTSLSLLFGSLPFSPSRRCPTTEVFLEACLPPSPPDLLTTFYPSHNRILPPPVPSSSCFYILPHLPSAALHYSPLHLSAMCSNCTYARGPQTLGLGSPGTNHQTLCQRMFNQAATLPKPDLRVKMM